MAADTPIKTPAAPAHASSLVSACVGVAALAIALLVHAPLAYSVGANAVFRVYLHLVLAQMPRLTGRYLSKNARATDQPVLVIFAVTLHCRWRRHRLAVPC